MQSKPTLETKKSINKLLNYIATYPDVKLRYHASNMVLYVDLDALYLVQPNAHSRLAGLFFLLNHHNNKIPPNPQRNHHILVECKTIQNVVTSAVEAGR